MGITPSAFCSFLVSVDMAHALHPNYQERHDPALGPKMHAGMVLKHNANQRYATNAVTAFFFRELGVRAGLPTQEFAVRWEGGWAGGYDTGACVVLRSSLHAAAPAFVAAAKGLGRMVQHGVAACACRLLLSSAAFAAVAK